MEGKVAGSDTGTLNDRLTVNESLTQFNNDSLKEVYGNIDKLDVEIKNTEDKLANWMEKEIAKVYDIINDNPLGN
jgi:hypothetical protein|tara:strand:+ start:781 stop:1005 length:225 start_codon:yes stop_codon:yes gene_type:complete